MGSILTPNIVIALIGIIIVSLAFCFVHPGLGIGVFGVGVIIIAIIRAVDESDRAVDESDF